MKTETNNDVAQLTDDQIDAVGGGLGLIPMYWLVGIYIAMYSAYKRNGHI